MKKYRLVAQELKAIERGAWINPRAEKMLKAAPMIVLFLLLNARNGHATCSFSPSPDPTVDGSPDSLRAAIQAADRSAQDCTITLSAGTYTLTIKNTNGHENKAAEGDLNLTRGGFTTTIVGTGAASTIINASSIDRAFQVTGGANAAIENLTIENGLAQDNGVVGALPGTTESEGGGILVEDGSQVTLLNVVLNANQAIGGTDQAAAGGGLFVSSGTAALTNSTISGNSAVGGNGAIGGNGHGGNNGGNGGFGSGGGLFASSSTITLSQSTLAANNASGGSGGRGGTSNGCATSSGGNTKCTSSVFGGSGGSGAQGAGGGLYLASGSATLTQCEVSGNNATGGAGANGGHGSNFGGTPGVGGAGQGAGISIEGGNITLANSTLFANQAKGGAGAGGLPGGDALGGGLNVNAGHVSLDGDTVASNEVLATTVEPAPQGNSYGGGIANTGATSLSANTTIIANNFRDSLDAGGGDDVSGAITANYSLFSSTDGVTITSHGHNLLDADPLLDPAGPQDNGGPTLTVSLEVDSPAIGAGDAEVCAAAPPAGLGGVDQRGYSRFPDGDTACDIGAYEFNGTPPAAPK